MPLLARLAAVRDVGKELDHWRPAGYEEFDNPLLNVVAPGRAVRIRMGPDDAGAASIAGRHDGNNGINGNCRRPAASSPAAAVRSVAADRGVLRLGDYLPRRRCRPVVQPALAPSLDDEYRHHFESILLDQQLRSQHSRHRHAAGSGDAERVGAEHPCLGGDERIGCSIKFDNICWATRKVAVVGETKGVSCP